MAEKKCLTCGSPVIVTRHPLAEQVYYADRNRPSTIISEERLATEFASLGTRERFLSRQTYPKWIVTNPDGSSHVHPRHKYRGSYQTTEEQAGYVTG